MNLTQELNKTEPNIFYQVEFSQPQSHLFEITLKIENWQQNILKLKMPVWTPGSYLVREYSRHIQEFEAKTEDNNKPLYSQKKSKNTWKINTETANSIIIKYKVFANELTVRTNHLDSSHAFFNGAALFFYIDQLQNLPIKIKITPPKKDWLITTSLPSISETKNTFLAENFDTLVDSPFEIGTQKIYDFKVLNKPHQWVIWSEGNLNIEKTIEDTKKIINTEANLFKGLPYEDYFFLLHLSNNLFGGLEHKNCCSLIYPRFNFQNKDKYHRFMQLVAHEFFHLWNIKRIRPKALENFDYEQENYTTSLWFAEGTTSYYDLLIPLRSKIYNRQTYLNFLSNEITKYFNIYGRNIQTLSESSFDAWIKLYRPDSYSNNCRISYYLKGELVSLLLDLLIRKNTKNKQSLDDVMVLMWEQFGKDEIGYTPTDLKQVIESVAKTDLTDFFNRYLHSTEELPFNDYLQDFGLNLKSITDKNSPPYLGINVKNEGGKDLITFVNVDSPAAIAGIDPGDELLAIDGFKVTSDTLSDRLSDYQAGNTINLTIFHEDELKTLELTLESPTPSRYEVQMIKNPSLSQKEMLNGFLG
jgi:predicted metalloprotease with PDZ domain